MKLLNLKELFYESSFNNEFENGRLFMKDKFLLK